MKHSATAMPYYSVPPQARSSRQSHRELLDRHPLSEQGMRQVTLEDQIAHSDCPHRRRTYRNALPACSTCPLKLCSECKFDFRVQSLSLTQEARCCWPRGKKGRAWHSSLDVLVLFHADFAPRQSVTQTDITSNGFHIVATAFTVQ